MAMTANSANVLRVLNLESQNPPASSSSSTSLKRMQIPFPNPKKKKKFTLITAAIVSAGLAHKFRSRNSILPTVGGNGGGGTNGGFGGGGGDGGGGRLPIELLSYPVNVDEDDKSHEITEADLKCKPFLEDVGINSGGDVVMEGSCFQKDSGGTYTETKAQLQKLLGKGGDLEAGTNPGGTTKGLRPITPKEEHTLGSISWSWDWDTVNGELTYMQQEDDVKTECNIFTGCGGPLTLPSLEPGGTMSLEHRNIHENASINGSVALGRILHPQDDISCNIKYVRPCSGGNTFCSSVHKSMTRGSDLQRRVDHPTWVDKVGIKANITSNVTPQISFSYGMVAELITALNCSNGEKLLNGTLTTPSDGNQRFYGQTILARDNTKFVNGAIVGDKLKFQVDLSPGVCERFPTFNRHELTATRFLPLKKVEEGFGKPSPPVCVLNAHYGGHGGYLLPQDHFTIGGPDSVRGYKVGEIGTARNILEVAGEVRVPVRNAQVYAFAEHGNALGSSMGNSTEGHGSSYGVGAKLGFFRIEYAINHNSHNGELSLRFGERFSGLP